MPYMLINEYPPDRMMLRVEAPNGRAVRLAEDEGLPQNVFSDLEFTTEMPGGNKELHGGLARNPQEFWAKDLGPFAEAELSQAGGEIVWSGFQDKEGKVSGLEHVGTDPVLLGWQYAMDDRKIVSVGYINADLTRWGDPTSRRRKKLIEEGYDYASIEPSLSATAPGQLTAGIMTNFAGFTKAANRGVVAEAWFIGRIPIYRVYFDYDQLTAAAAAELWESTMALAADDLGTLATSGTDYDRTNVRQEMAFHEALEDGITCARLRDKYSNTAATFDMTDQILWGNLRVLGRTGLTLQGTWPEVGYTTKQMLTHFISTYCAPLTVDEAYMDDDGFIIPQAWYDQGEGSADIIKDLVKFSLYDWFVYTGKRFEFREPLTYGREWTAYIGTSDFNEVGEDSQSLWTSVVVQYQDTDGTTKLVGPPGTRCDYESSTLEITDVDHPAVKAERTRREFLQMNGVGTPATAVAIGERFLAEANRLNRSGSATLNGFVSDSKGTLRPVAQVKAGDTIRFIDAADTSARKIVNTSYSHGGRSCEIDLDAPPAGMEELLERLQVTTAAYAGV
jgi:hypothetical protein